MTSLILLIAGFLGDSSSFESVVMQIKATTRRAIGLVVFLGDVAQGEAEEYVLESLKSDEAELGPAWGNLLPAYFRGDWAPVYLQGFLLG
jgi:hypothetical protein